MRVMRYALCVMSIIVLTVVSPVRGQTVLPSTAPTMVGQDIQNFKDKIATKVAELRKKNLKAVAGIVTDIATGSLKIKTNNDEDYTIKADNALTKSYVIVSVSKKEIKFTDLKKGAYIIASGPLADKVVSANVIYQDEQYLVKAGKITEINKDEFFLKVLTSDKDTYTLDIETTTKTQMLDSKTVEVVTSGFSKMKEGDTIHFMVKKTSDEKHVNRYPALKILIIPQEYFIK